MTQRYTYVVRKDGTIALRTTGSISCPAGCVLVESYDVIKPSEARYDFGTKTLGKVTRHQKAQRTRVVNGKRKDAEELRQAALADLKLLLQDEKMRRLVACLTSLHPLDVQVALGEEVRRAAGAGAETPAPLAVPTASSGS